MLVKKCVSVYTLVYLNKHVDQVSSPPLHGSWALNSSLQALLLSMFPAESSHWPSSPLSNGTHLSLHTFTLGLENKSKISVTTANLQRLRKHISSSLLCTML